MRLVVVGGLLAVAIVIVLIFSPGLVTDLDGRVYDSIARGAGPGQPSGNVVIVAIDQASLAQVGRWPWPRASIAKLIRLLTEAGASTVVLDMMFPEPDSTPPATNARTEGGLSSNDRELAQAVAKGRVVLGYYFGLEGNASGGPDCALAPRSLVIEESAPPRSPPLFRASNVLCDVAPIARNAAALGFLNGAPDSDGKLRRLPLLIEYKEHVYPSLALAAFLANSHSRWLKVASDGTGTATLRIDAAEVPLGSHGDLLLRFRGKSGSLPHVPAEDILAGRAPVAVVRNKIAFVGSVAPGLEPTWATPAGAFLPGVEVQATAADNLLRLDFFSRPGWTRVVDLAIGLIAGLCAAFVLSTLRPLPGLATLAALCALGWVASLACLKMTGLYLSPLPLLIAAAAEFAVLSPARATIERARAARFEGRLKVARKFMLSVLQSLTANQDSEAGVHLERMQRYMRLLCEAAARKPAFRKALSNDTLELLVQLAPIHDLGKIGVPAHILARQGALTFEEWEVMKAHVAYGYDLLEKAYAASGAPADAIYRLAQEIVRSHHERWDGKGYPQGLAREDIPLSARLLAVADVYDALISHRAYKPAVPHLEAVQKIVAGSGSQFDPAIVAVFVEVKDSFQRVAEELPGGRKV